MPDDTHRSSAALLAASRSPAAAGPTRKVLVIPRRETVCVLERVAARFRYRRVAAPRARLAARWGAVAAWLGLASVACATFQQPLVGPPAAAMGNASLAHDGASGESFLNPAALASLSSASLYMTYAQLYAGLRGVGSIGQGFLSLGVPTRLGVVGVGLGDFKAEGLHEERQATLSFARLLPGRILAGVSLKWLQSSFSPGDAAAGDPVFANRSSRSGLGADVGLAAFLGRGLRIGAACRNALRPDLGLAVPDRLPREYQAGAAYRLERLALTLTADATFRDAPSGALSDRLVPSVGLEKGLVGEAFRLRLGADSRGFSGGAGFRLGRLSVDYAFIITRNLLVDNAGTHMLGLGYRIGGAEPDPPPSTLAARAGTPNDVPSSP